MTKPSTHRLPKLAFVSTMEAMPWGGSEYLWHETALLALAKGWGVMTATFRWEPAAPEMQRLAAAGAQSYFRPFYPTALVPRILNRTRRLLGIKTPEIKTLVRFAPDLIVVNLGSGYDVMARPDLLHFLLGSRIPYVVLSHNYDLNKTFTEPELQLLRQFYTKAVGRYFICRPQVTEIQRVLGCRFASHTVVKNPVRLQKQQCLPLPPGESVQLASVASFHTERKGQDLLLQALSGDRWGSRSWVLNFYGEGPDREGLAAQATALGLGERVAFKGYEPAVEKIWQHNHLLVISSRIETGPMVLTEAMLCGRVPVTTEVGLAGDLVRHGDNGFLAPSITAAGIDEALETAWQRREDWSALGVQAFKDAQQFVDPHPEQSFLALLEAQMHLEKDNGQ